jgi:hypothetical protein
VLITLDASAVSSATFIAIPILVLAAAISLEIYGLRELAHARRLVYLTREQWKMTVLLLGPLGATTFLYLERDR